MTHFYKHPLFARWRMNWRVRVGVWRQQTISRTQMRANVKLYEGNDGGDKRGQV